MNLHNLSAEDEGLIREFFQLFHSEFKEATRESDEQIWDEIHGKYRLPMRITAALENGTLAALARFSPLTKTGAVWLVHVAVQPQLRGSGLGTRLIKSLIEQFSPLPIVVEVEPEASLTAWYERLGFSLVSRSYIQPALHAHTQPVPLLLMTSREFSGTSNFIQNFYEEAWALPFNDPLVQSALEGITPGR